LSPLPADKEGEMVKAKCMIDNIVAGGQVHRKGDVLELKEDYANRLSSYGYVEIIGEKPASFGIENKKAKIKDTKKGRAKK
jgi:hypothetical protein